MLDSENRGSTGSEVEAEGSRQRLPFLQGFLAGFLSSFLAFASAGFPSAESFLRRFTMGLHQVDGLQLALRNLFLHCFGARQTGSRDLCQHGVNSQSGQDQN